MRDVGSVHRSPLKGNFPDMYKPAANSLTLLPFFLFYQIFFNIHVFLLQFFCFLRAHAHTKIQVHKAQNVRRSARTKAVEPAGLQIWAENR